MSGSLRVIAGTLKGRRLKAPTWEGLRPTSDKLRETLFNVLARRTPGARLLDGFAGTGALGIEALSRGAAHVTFIDRDPRAAALIADNLARCGIESGYAIIRAPFDLAVRSVQAPAPFDPFDIVLLDPPYQRERGDAGTEAGALLEAVDAVVAGGGIVVFEHARARVMPGAAAGLSRVRRVSNGDSVLSLYER
jgi:16S rRNA (guanine966-N2)-methyltransferase